MTRLRIAAAAYPVEALPSWEAYAAKLDTWVAEAAGQADLLVFPEYAGVEATLAGLSDPPEDPKDWLALTSAADPALVALHSDLAARHGVAILSGSNLVACGTGHVNRARLHLPSGAVGQQDKIVPTPWERRDLALQGGTGLTAFDTPFGRIGVLICYDGEFPILARALAEAGCWLILIPSATEKTAGYWRVRIGAMARALEQRCITVQAPLSGFTPKCALIDINVGAAGVFCPPDEGFPPTGIVALGQIETPGWTFATVDRADFDHAAPVAQVSNPSDWPMQAGPARNVAIQALC
ncbi:carbon-nitrogen hydrolase family protein [Palleronia sp. KMU-117]|uniref:carbon-nitrogen hydrolase family protein n=1 Tax=Palleronia sp. KMU-117 TaxID=3434108 RepID=UPI003D756129